LYFLKKKKKKERISEVKWIPEVGVVLVEAKVNLTVSSDVSVRGVDRANVSVGHSTRCEETGAVAGCIANDRCVVVDVDYRDENRGNAVLCKKTQQGLSQETFGFQRSSLKKLNHSKQ
jgi:hypothetical protein